MDLLEKSIAFALRAHEGQTRKKSGTPFILHPMEAVTIASTLTDDRDVLAAVMLHDTVEDTDTTLEDIRREFGDRVAQLVQGETENEYPELTREESWKLRKEESLTRLRVNQDRSVKIMWLSDKLSNARSLLRIYVERGDDMWEIFHQKDKRVQEWYYRAVADALEEFSDTPAYREYVVLIDYIFGGQHEKSTA
jgi:(p)ppGpp synthase/HD superfamily hydrolase